MADKLITGKFDPKGLMSGLGSTMGSYGTLLGGHMGGMDAEDRGGAIGGAVGGTIGSVAEAFIPIPGLGAMVGQVGSLAGQLIAKKKGERERDADNAAVSGRTYGAFNEQINVDPYGAGNSAYMEDGGMPMGLSMFMLNTQLPVKATVNPLDAKLMVDHGLPPSPMEDEIEMMADGGIHIKKKNRGKFTAWAKAHNMSVQQAASSILKNKGKHSSTLVKRANFARNASKWKKEEGGMIMPDLNMDVNDPKFGSMFYDDSNSESANSMALGGLTGFGGDDPTKPVPVYKNQAEVNAANAEAVRMSTMYGKMNAQDSYVARKPGDPVIRYYDQAGKDITGVPQVTIPLAQRLPRGMTAANIQQAGGKYWYTDLNTGYDVDLDPNYAMAQLPKPSVQAQEAVIAGRRKFKKGGYVTDPEPKRKPIYTNNPNDKRLKAYNDSLGVYNSYVSDNAFWSGLPHTTLKRKAMQEVYPEGMMKNGTVGSQKLNLKPIAYNNYNYTPGKYTIDRATVPVYKEPVQPIIYRDTPDAQGQRLARKPIPPVPTKAKSKIKEEAVAAIPLERQLATFNIQNPSFQQKEQSKNFSFSYPDEKGVQQSIYFPTKAALNTFVDRNAVILSGNQQPDHYGITGYLKMREGGIIDNNLNAEDMYTVHPGEIPDGYTRMADGRLMKTSPMQMKKGGRRKRMTSYYAEGGMPGEEQLYDPSMEQQEAAQQPQVDTVNIQYGELAVDPKTGEIVKKFSNKARYSKHADSPLKEPAGNFVSLPTHVVIIPAKLAQGYEHGNKLTRSTMLRQILKDQMKREQTGQQEFTPAPGADAVPQAALGYYDDPTPKLFAPGSLGARQAARMRAAAAQNIGQPTPFIPPGGGGGGDLIIDPLGEGTPRFPSTAQPVGSGATWDAGLGNVDAGNGAVVDDGVVDNRSSWLNAVLGSQFLPAASQFAESFRGNPNLKLHTNRRFGDARSYIGQMPTDVNSDAAKGALGRAQRTMARQYGNFRRADVAGDMAVGWGNLIDRTGEIETNEQEREQQAQGAKLQALGQLAISQGADQQGAEREYDLAKEQDAAANRNMRYNALSESTTRFSKNFMDNEKLRVANEMATFYRVNPQMKKMIEDNPHLGETIRLMFADALSSGAAPYMPYNPNTKTT